MISPPTTPNAVTLARMLEFQIRTTTESCDFNHIAYNARRRLEALGIEPMSIEEFNSGSAAFRDLRSRLARRGGER
jgi:hypothetical protein